MASDRARPLGQLSLIALGLNGVIGVGIFFVPASVARHVPGSAGAFVYLATAVACLPIALAFSRLAPRFDEDGGPYVYARAAFGPGAAYVMGWLTYVSAVLSTSAVIRGLAAALTHRWSGHGILFDPTRLVASATVVGLVLLTAIGLRVSALAWTAITAAKLVPLALLLGAWALSPAMVASPDALTAASSAATPATAGSVLRAGLIVVFALQGFEIVPVPAGHVREPKAMSRATLSALLIASVVYFGLQLACVHALPGLAASRAPLVDAARVYGGDALARVLDVGTSVSALGISLGMVAITPRYLATLGRDDGLGTWIGHTSMRGVPLRALVLTGVAVLAFVQFGSLDELFAMSSIAVLAQYGATAASLAFLGARRKRGLGRGEVVLGAFAIVAALAVAAGASWREVGRALAVMVVGVLLRLVVSRWAARPAQS